MNTTKTSTRRVLEAAQYKPGVGFARQPQHGDVGRYRKDQNKSRWSPIIPIPPIFSDPQSSNVRAPDLFSRTAHGVCLLLFLFHDVTLKPGRGFLLHLAIVVQVDD
jgi:hypothetical protein